MRDIFADGEKFRSYIIDRELGRGGLGAVYLAHHALMDADFAIKILDPDVAEVNPEYVKRFVREAKIASKIRHAGLVAVHDVGFDDAKGVYFIVMDYVNGWDLRASIGMGGAINPNEAVRIVSCVAEALAAAEPFGVVHRDIKPENIMIDQNGCVKLVDMGVAKARDTDSLQTTPQTIFGTPNYISPEQARDASNVDARADIYSLGIVLFELLCGRRPYETKNPRDALVILLSSQPVRDIREFKPDIDPGLAAIIAKMCEKNPAKRIPSASALIAAFQKAGYATGQRISAQAQAMPTVDMGKIIATPQNNTPY